MARVPIHDIDSAPEASKEALERQSKRVGKTINIFGAMAHSPAVMGLYDAAEELLGERSNLDRRTREAIHLTIANVNQCDYCQAAYTGSAKAQGFSEEQTVQIRKGAVDEDDKLTALLALARELAEHKGEVADDTWQAALDAGWSDVELLDAYADVVRTVLTNWFNHLVGTELDLPAAPALD
ncbi:MAG: carboxymuconolactone decarboxylase family protein [Nitriliruptor sp.]|uniref:carboxymuconolactone decarboxylase family protein n=1 Tax=Nitriliruptor sp. TaxID=2448056 RepID=UPI0034A07BCE